MLKVAITGNVASGKSLLAEVWVGAGVPVVSADDLAREVVEPGTPGLEAVIQAFGPELLEADGRLNRQAMGKIVFSDPERRRRLEEILHPLIARRREEWMMGEARRGARLAVAEIPLLFEVGLEEAFDAVVIVDAPPEERLRRLTELRGLSKEEALRIMAAQMAPEEKLGKADFVIHNSGTTEDLEVRALALLDLLQARAAGKGAS
jgi:dephospho-CoA kinase